MLRVSETGERVRRLHLLSRLNALSLGTNLGDRVKSRKDRIATIAGLKQTMIQELHKTKGAVEKAKMVMSTHDDFATSDIVAVLERGADEEYSFTIGKIISISRITAGKGKRRVPLNFPLPVTDVTPNHWFVAQWFEPKPASVSHYRLLPACAVVKYCAVETIACRVPGMLLAETTSSGEAAW